MLLLLLLTATANAQMLGGGGGMPPAPGGGGQMVGGQSGKCCGSCGYLWCKTTKSCYRPTTDTCSVELNAHGCPLDCAQYHKDFNVIDCATGATVNTLSWSSVGNCALTKFAATITPTAAPVVTNLGGGGLVGGNGPNNVGGCCQTCGYMYCAAKKECYRPWMVEANYCPSPPTASPVRLIGGTNPNTGCCSSCGEVLCKTTGKCYRPWEPNACQLTVNQHGCPIGCNEYHKAFNVIDCNTGKVLRTESWSSIGSCASTMAPSTSPSKPKTKMIKTTAYCAKLGKKDCKKRSKDAMTGQKMCKYAKKKGCAPVPGVPATMTPPEDKYMTYSAVCKAAMSSTDCTDAGCDWNKGICYAYSKSAAKCSRFKDAAQCANYGCKSKSGGKCRGKPKEFK